MAAVVLRAEARRGLPEEHLRPVKLNCDVLGNSLPHLHTHVIPRYAEDPLAASTR
jgi:diadenosine tetraphosphate (Ap4A) HIT family hydrolase